MTGLFVACVEADHPEPAEGGGRSVGQAYGSALDPGSSAPEGGADSAMSGGRGGSSGSGGTAGTELGGSSMQAGASAGGSLDRGGSQAESGAFSTGGT